MNHFLSYLKRILLFSIVWLPLRAQTPDVCRNKMNSVFANIDRSAISTGYLSEHASPLVPLESFDSNGAELRWLNRRGV